MADLLGSAATKRSTRKRQAGRSCAKAHHLDCWSDLCAVMRSSTMSTSQTCRRGLPAVYVADESHGDEPIWSMWCTTPT